MEHRAIEGGPLHVSIPPGDHSVTTGERGPPREFHGLDLEAGVGGVSAFEHGSVQTWALRLYVLARAGRGCCQGQPKSHANREQLPRHCHPVLQRPETTNRGLREVTHS